MDRLKPILSLPFSRKFILALLVPLLAVANRRLGLGFSDQEVFWGAAGIIAVILGISFEDMGKSIGGLVKPAPAGVGGGEATSPEPPKPAGPGTIALLVLVAAAPLALLTGCLEVHQRDPVTVTQVERTIENRRHDYDVWKKQLQTPTPTARDLKGAEGLQAAELDRLEAWRKYESSKTEK